MTLTNGEIAQCFCTWSLPNDELFCQDHCVGRLVESPDDDVPDEEDWYLQLAIFMDKAPPKIGLRNLCLIPIPPHHLTADLDVQRQETPGDLDRLGGADRAALDVMIGVGNPVTREKLPRALAGRSPCAIVQYDVGHDSPPVAATGASSVALERATVG
ncbi:MAG TPA: hypothetical protein VFF86_09925 [Candidatus Methylomirabilis sp.]|nr:hypothetical protein [Candidatus Methylomirabilis sp.]